MAHRVDENPSIFTHKLSLPQADASHPANSTSYLEKIKRSFNFSSEESFTDEIAFFQKVLLDTDCIEVGSRHSTPSTYTNSSTICGLISRLHHFIKNPLKDFNISLKEFEKKHKPIFDNLITSLNEDFETLQTHKDYLKQDGDKFFLEPGETHSEKRYIFRKNGRYYITPSENTKKATQLLLNKLFELKFSGRGLLNNIPYLTDSSKSQPPPLLEILDKDLRKLHVELTKYPPNDKLILKHYKNVERTLSHSDQLIPWYTLNQEDKNIIAHFRAIFSEHIKMPSSLKRDERFFPSYFDLNKEMLRLKNFIAKKITERSSLRVRSKNIVSNTTNYLLDSAKTSVGDSFKKQLPYLYGLAEFISKQGSKEPIQQTKPHPLHVFCEALEFFSKPSSIYTPEKKLELLEELLKECQVSFKEFESDLIKALSKNLVKTDPHFLSLSKDQQKNHAKKYLFHDLKKLKNEILPVVIKEKTSKLPSQSSLETRLAFLTHSDTDPSSENFSTPTSYLQMILNIINNPGGELMKAPVRFMILNFNKFIQKSIDKVLTSVNEADKELLLSLKSTAKTNFEKALSTNSLDEYRSAITSFFQAYNKLQINLDCIELPAVFKKTESNSEDPQEIITETLAKSKTLNPVMEDEEVNWEVETQKQAKILSETSTNYLIFNLIYNTLLGFDKNNETDQLFFDICTKLKAVPTKSERQKLFLKELKEIIENSSQNSILKGLAKILVNSLVYNTTYSRVDTFTKSILEIIKDSLNDLESNPYEPVNTNIIQRIDQCTSQYQLMLEKWAVEGGNKELFIEELMRKGDFNKGKSRTYSQDELYSAVSNKLVFSFTDGIDTTELLKSVSDRYYSWYNGESPLEKSTTSNKNKTLNSIKKYTKKFFNSEYFKKISYPFFLTGYYLTYSVCIILNKVIRFVTGMLLRQNLKKNNVIENLIETSQEAIYKKNPYVDIITDFLIDNLEDLDIALFEKDKERREFNKSGVAANDLKDQQAKMPPKTRKKLKQALLNCFQLLEKNKHLTSDELKKALKLTPQSSLESTKNYLVESLEGLVTPRVIDSLIEVLAISSDVLLKKEHLEKQLAKIITQINQSLTTNKEDESQNKNLEQLNQMYFQNELRLAKLLEKIIKKTISLSVNEEFDRFGDRYYRENENQKIWIQSKLLGSPEDSDLGFISKWHSLLDELEKLKTSEEDLSSESIEKQRDLIQSIKTESESFLAEFSLKLESARESSLSERSTEKLYAQLRVLSKSFQVFENTYLLELYSHTENIFKLDKDKTTVDSLKSSYDSLLNQFKKLSNTEDIDESIKILDEIQTLNQTIRITIENLGENELSIGLDPNLEDILSFHESSQWQEKYKSLYSELETSLISKKVFDLLIPELDTLSRKKKSDLNKDPSKIETLKSYFKSTKKIYSESYEKILKAFNESPENPIYNDFKTTYLKNIVEAKNQEEVDKALDEAKKFIMSTIKKLPTKKKITSIEKLLSPVQGKSKDLLDTIQTLINRYNKKNLELIDKTKEENIFKQLEHLRCAATDMRSIQHIDIPLGVVEFLKQQTISIVYSLVKPKADEALDVLKDENMAKFFANYLVLIPLADASHK